MSRLVIVDGNNRMWAAFHAYKRLSYKGESVASIYGFPSMMRALLGKLKPDEFMIVWDGKKSKHRLKIFPDYKGDRKSKDLIDYDNWKLQKKVVQRLMDFLGIKQVWNSDVEADDMIYKLTKLAGKNGFKEVIIVSGDKDFNQLIGPAKDGNPEVMVYSEAKKTLINYINCEREFGYKAYQTVDYLSLVGDSSDNIPGYRGMGEKRTKSFLNEFLTIKLFLKDKRNKFPIIDRDTLLEVVERNRILIDLRYFYSIHRDEMKTVFYNNKKNPKLNKKKFLKLCAKYNMQKLMGKSFIKPFKQLQR